MTPSAQAAVSAARRAVFAIGLLALVGVAMLAPEGDGRDLERVLDWLRFRGDPSLVAVFNYLGVWPMVYASVLLSDRPAGAPAWPFVGLSFFAGGFVLLPYLAIRRWSAPRSDEPGAITRLATGRPFAALLLVAGWGLLVWGLLAGSPDAYAEQWRRSALVFTMSADFVALTLAWWPILLDDVGRRGGPSWAAILGAVPIVGAPLWLVFRAR